jgi:hypothetical protein
MIHLIKKDHARWLCLILASSSTQLMLPPLIQNIGRHVGQALISLSINRCYNM